MELEDVEALAWGLSARRAAADFNDLDDKSKLVVDLFLHPIETRY